MASESGYSNQLKKGTSQFKTIHSVGSNKFGQSVAIKGLFEITSPAAIVSTTEIVGDDGQINAYNIEITSHNAKKGDVLRLGSGDSINYEFDILEIINPNTVQILALVPIGSFTGNQASIMGWVTSKSSSDGSSIVTISSPAKVGTYQENLALSTVATFTAPTGSTGFMIQADDTNTANVRWKVGGIATASSGMQLQPGRSEQVTLGGNVSVVAESGTQKVSIQFGV